MTVSFAYSSFLKKTTFESVRATDKNMEILEKELKNSVPSLAESIIKEIESGDKTMGRMLYKGTDPIGAVIYDREPSPIKECQEKKIGLLLQKCLVFKNADSRDKEFIFQALVEKVIGAARDLKAECVFTHVLRDQDEFKVLRRKNFSELKMNSQSKDVILISQLVQEVTKKRKNEEPDQGRNYSDLLQKTQKTNYKNTQSKNMGIHEATLKKMYLNQILSGKKTIEGRIDSGMFKKMQEGDKIRFFCNDLEVYCLIKKISKYNSFEEMLKTEGYQKCLPDVFSLEAAVRAYSVIPGYDQRASQSGVLALHIEVIEK